jgi:hypothetical protein
LGTDPLFRARDRSAMRHAFDLLSHDDVAAYVEAILGRLKPGTMRCDRAWPAGQAALLKHWLAQGGSE